MPSPTERIPDCATVVRALWEYLDQELEEPEMAVIAAHLDACESCRAHFAFERELIQSIRALRVQHPEPHALRTRLLEVLRQARTADPDR